MIDILRDSESNPSITTSYIAHINTLENIDIVLQYAHEIENSEPDLYKLIDRNKNDDLIEDFTTILFKLNKSQNLQNIQAASMIKDKNNMVKYIKLYNNKKDDPNVKQLTSEINNMLAKEDEYYKQHKKYPKDRNQRNIKLHEWFNLIGINDKIYYNIYDFERITKGSVKDYEITDIDKKMAKYSAQFTRDAENKLFIYDIIRKLNKNGKYPPNYGYY